MEGAKKIVLNDSISESNALSALGMLLEKNGFDILFCTDEGLSRLNEIGYKCTHYIETMFGNLYLCERPVDK